jgi:cyclopropane fatty-acyl-phospholipid synthase-like methyltransferase
MGNEDRFRQRYQTGDTPWDIGRPDPNLIQIVTTVPIEPSKALDIGCGTGDNSIWLYQQGFRVVGIDTSEIAIEKAREKASSAGAECAFSVRNILKSHVEGAPFGFLFDRGCFHILGSDKERESFAEKINGHLEKNGLWLSIVGNADEQRNGPGPPQRTARDIVNAVEPHFEILSLATGFFGSKSTNPPRAWICLMRKR